MDLACQEGQEGKGRQKGRIRELWAASQEAWVKPDSKDEELLGQVVKS